MRLSLNIIIALGLFVHLHAPITDGAFEERDGDASFLPAATPPPERLTAVLAQVHKVVAEVAEDDDLDLDPALAACVQLGLAGPHLVPPQEPAISAGSSTSGAAMGSMLLRSPSSRARKPGRS